MLAVRAGWQVSGLSLRTTVRAPSFAAMDVASVLLAAQSPDAAVRVPAEQQIEAAKASNLVGSPALPSSSARRAASAPPAHAEETSPPVPHVA